MAGDALGLPAALLPVTYRARSAWRVLSDGSYGCNGCSNSYGLRPALKLKSDLLVSTDGDDEEERPDGECDNYKIDLSRVDTASLLKEIERRVALTAHNTRQGDCGVQP